MKRQMLARKLTYLILFLLPWQTRWIFSQQLLQGSVWEYGKVSVYGVEILMGILFLLRAKKTQWPRSFVIPVLVIGFTFLFSLLFSEQRVISLVVIGHVLFVIGFVFCLLNKDLSVSVLLKVFFVGLIIPCLFGWFQVLTGSSPSMKWLGLAVQNSTVLGTSVVEIGTERLLRAYGSFPHPNIFGGYLAIGIFLLFWFLVTKRKERVSFWLLFCLILFSSTLVITFSRSAWLGLIITFVFFFMGNIKKRFFSFQRAWPFLMIIFLSSILSIFLFQEAFSTRLRGQARLEQKSVMERQESLSFFSPVFFRNPFSGTGPGAYTVVLSQVFPFQPIWFYQPLHNAYLLFFCEMGVVGIFAGGWLFMKIGQRYRKKKQLFLGISFFLIPFIIGFFDHYLWSMWPGVLLLGFLFAISLHAARQKR